MAYETTALARARKLLTGALLAALALAGLAWSRKGALPERASIDPRLLQDPIQGETEREPFSFSYLGKTYDVQPVASYELWGLVVALNDPLSFTDITHDASSVDTKDFGVIWGKNLQRDDYQRVRFTHGDYTLYWQYPAGVTFHSDSVANNHLVTQDAGLRERIAQVRTGDQVHLRGMLVNYRNARHPDAWRTTSRTRTDVEANACEVVFLEELNILRRATPVWYALYQVGRLAALGALVGLGVVLWRRARPGTTPPPSGPSFLVR